MKKRLSLTDILLLSISGIFDLLDEIKDPGGLIKNYYENFYGYIPQRFQKASIYTTINKNYRKKRLVKRNKKLILTRKGKKYLQDNFPRFFYRSNNWDGYFYFVIFDLIELKRNQRDRLRRLLKRLKFAYLQKSVWITYNHSFLKPIFEFKKFYRLEKDILIIKAKFEENKNLSKLVQKIWLLNEINDGYKKIFIEYQKSLLDYQENNNLRIFLERYEKISKKFYQIYQEDPLIPSVFLPHPWYFFEGLKIKKEIAKIIKNKNKVVKNLNVLCHDRGSKC